MGAANAGLTQWLYMASPDSVLRGLSRGMFRFGGSEAVDVEDNLIDLDDVVFWDFQKSANCRIKSRPTVVSKCSQLSHQKSAN